MSDYIIYFLFILVVIILLWLVVYEQKSHIVWALKSANQAKAKKVAEAKNKILVLFVTQKEIHNRDVENLLSVSDATATNYLDGLQKEGKITQHGEIGRGVFYTQING